VEITDFSQSFFDIHSRVEATIAYVLLSPSGPFGGTFEETSGQLFKFFVDIDDGQVLTRTSNTTVGACLRPRAPLSAT
jgi:hypothetical protein